MNNDIILEPIPFEPDLNALMRKLRVKAGSTYADELKRLVREAQSIARPKALYKTAFIEARSDDYVVIDGTRLSSRVLRVNLDHAHRTFPYVATCGVELDAWSDSIDDIVHQYWADIIKEQALRTALHALQGHLAEHYQLGRTASMSPGSLENWPIQEQRPLFTILGNTREAIGVELTDSFLMIPTKSVSGIRFPTEESFESCQLCPRENCPGRRAPYEPALYEERYSALKRSQPQEVSNVNTGMA